MGVLLSQRLSVFYERFKNIEVTFTKEMIQVTGLLTQQVHLKCGNDFFLFFVYNTSFENTKVVANIKTGLLGKLQQTNNFINLRFSFKPPGETNPVTFFVAGRVLASAPYGNSQDVHMFTIQFSNRPPDDFIEIVGRVLDANVNSAKRKDDRIPLTPENLRKLNILTTESTVFIERVPRRCILRDISFSGSKLIMMGVAKFLLEKDGALKIEFNDPKEAFLVQGKFVRAEMVEGKKEMVALGLSFNEATLPMGFKIRLNEMLTSQRADFRGTTEDTAAAKLAKSKAALAAHKKASQKDPSAAKETPPPAKEETLANI
jgi:hypothetical protein